MKYRFQASIVVDASSIEDALNQVSTHLGRVKRHAAEGVDLKTAGAAFTLSENANGEVADLSDPLAPKPEPAPIPEPDEE